MEKEIWKDIKGYEGLYQVSNLGRIKSLPREFWNSRGFYSHTKEKILKLVDYASLRAYKAIGLTKDLKQVHYLVHRLVAGAFINEIPEGMVVNHIDGNKTNNNLNNLEIVTQRENIIKDRQINKTKKHRLCKYKVIDINSDDEYIFDNSELAGKFLGVTGATVRNYAFGIWTALCHSKYIIEPIDKKS